MRIPRPAALLIVLVLAAPLAWADEIVHFTNGSSLPVKSYRIENGVITVDLGDAATMAFPEYLVERIEGTKKKLADKGYDANLAKSGPRGGGRGGSNQAVDFNNVQDVQILELPGDVKVDSKTGLTTQRPFAGSAASNRRKLQNAGNMRVMEARQAHAQGGGAAVRMSGGKTVISKGGRSGGGSPAKRKVSPTLAHPNGAPKPKPVSPD